MEFSRSFPSVTFAVLTVDQSVDQSVERSKRQLSISLRWPIYLINPVDKSKILCFTSPPTQHHSFFRN